MNLLYLVHRLPYPPNKGDKVRSFHLLKHLAASHRVFLGTFVDDPDDLRHVDGLRSLCADVHACPLDPRLAKIRSLTGLTRGEALTLPYYRDGSLAAWVDSTLARERIDGAVVFSSAMAQYVTTRPDLPLLVDFVDLDSAKWGQYAQARRWPLSWLYRREGARLLAFEGAVARRAEHSFFVTEKEAELFRKAAPESAGRVEAIENGVDADFFRPDPQRPSPFDPEEVPLVFTGAMDYWPNVDAVVWFAEEVLPELLRRWNTLRFHVVGRNPTETVRRLAGKAVSVSGTVADVRPYLQHAAAVVTPLRVARGIQNKILEAMAMARPVVASRACAAAIEAKAGAEFVAVEDARDFVASLDRLLRDRAAAEAMGEAARRRVLERYSWDAHLARIDDHLGRFARTPAAHARRAP